MCEGCQLIYVGKTVDTLRNRINKHFNELSLLSRGFPSNDGMYLHRHIHKCSGSFKLGIAYRLKPHQYDSIESIEEAIMAELCSVYPWGFNDRFAKQDFVYKFHSQRGKSPPFVA